MVGRVSIGTKGRRFHGPDRGAVLHKRRHPSSCSHSSSWDAGEWSRLAVVGVAYVRGFTACSKTKFKLSLLCSRHNLLLNKGERKVFFICINIFFTIFLKKAKNLLISR